MFRDIYSYDKIIKKSKKINNLIIERVFIVGWGWGEAIIEGNVLVVILGVELLNVYFILRCINIWCIFFIFKVYFVIES